MATLEGVWSLDLRYNGDRLTDDDLQSIARMRHLKRLYVDQSAISDAGVKHLSGTKLESLSLRLTAVTDDSFSQLRKMQHLGQLGLAGTKMTASTIKKLSAALPNCTISYIEGGAERILGPSSTPKAN